MESVYVDVSLCQRPLVGVERREGLQFDQLGLQFSLGIANESKVNLHEHRVRRFVLNFELCGNCLVGFCPIFRIVHELANEFLARAGHAVDQFFREEARSFRQAELDVSSADLINSTQKLLIFIGRETRVELPAQRRNHSQAV